MDAECVLRARSWQGHRHPPQYCLQWTGRVSHASASVSQNSDPNMTEQDCEQKAVTFKPFEFNHDNSLKGSENESLLWADPHKTLPCVSQVNMLIGIVVFNKLMSRDGISDKSKKQRAG